MNSGAGPNLVLTGFMGTGKSRVGREVARQLGRPFVDMDAEIEARAGKPIPRIFAEDGEATFRRMETALCEELSAPSGQVIATGGGALVDPANRAAMMRGGTVVCLTCEPDEILHRVRGAGYAGRPLLDVADPPAELEQLLAARREAYDAIPWQVDTTTLPAAEVVKRVIALADVITLPVRYPGGEYPVHVGEGLLDYVGGALRAAGSPEGGRVAIVSNPVVAPLHAARIEASVRGEGFQPFPCTLPDGEPHKTLATVADLYDQFLASGLDRGGTVLSLGGGVTGDVAGFAAATYLRGVPLAQVPTTLLAMVDASVGGKTGVDLPQGKNLVGAFKQPGLVLVDPAVLATLPSAEVRSGMAEVIKHGVIGAPDLFADLEGLHAISRRPLSTPQLARALQVKIEVVEADPLEQGQRATLNLGHTVGHALERLSGFTLRHGEAVAIGMVVAARISAELGRAETHLPARIEAALSAWDLPVRCPPFDVEAIWQAMAYDKKRRGHSLRWVLPRAIGQVEIDEDVPAAVVRSVLKDLGARSER